jgi:glycosyltransferase involved in cell wall biosynthesis
VITTDWGGFVETVEQGKTGFRCRTLQDFADATEKVRDLSRGHIRHRARSLYSTEVVKHQYQDYFDRLMTLYGEGWYA